MPWRIGKGWDMEFGIRADLQSFRREVGIGSRSEEEEESLLSVMISERRNSAE